MLLDELTKEIKTLKVLAKSVNKKVTSGSERLNISTYRGKPRYYRRNIENGTTIYLPDTAEAAKLAQMDYYRKLKPILDQELKAAEELEEMLKRTTVENLYGTLHPARQALVDPVIPTEEQYVAQWEAVTWERKDVDLKTASKTLKGEYVRSKSEALLADRFYHYKRPYRYEFHLDMGEYGIWHPDFTILNPRTRQVFIWEHFGMMDDPDYLNNFLRKMDLYRQNGFFEGKNLVATYETREHPLNMDTVDRLIKEYLL